MKKDLFNYTHYKEYLNDRLDDPERGGGRGARARLSQFVGCQTAYTAQVLRGPAHFSLEQAESINEFLAHTEEESHFFILLVQSDRAGTVSLRRRFLKQLQEIRDHRRDLKNRFEAKAQLDLAAQTKYYSNWHYSALHALASIPAFQSVESMSKHLNLSPTQIAESLDFLNSVGILQRQNKSSRYEIGKAQIHLGSDSPLINQHHLNWRLQAMRSLERKNAEDLHYSSATSMSQHDFHIIREMIAQLLQNVKKIIRDSNEEKPIAFNIDFFSF